MPVAAVEAIAHSFAARTRCVQAGAAPVASGSGFISSQIGILGAVPTVLIAAMSVAPAPAIWWQFIGRMTVSSQPVPVQISSG